MLSSAFPRCVHVDVWEDNWVVSENGKTVAFKQIILWDWAEHDGVADYYVRDWQLAERCVPAVPWGGAWIGVFKGRLVIARVYRETAYVADIEMKDRARVPESHRDKIQRRWPSGSNP